MGLYIGLMSGTSMDGIDAALVEIDTHCTTPRLKHYIEFPYPPDLKNELVQAVNQAQNLALSDFTLLDQRVGEVFARAALELIEQSQTPPAQITAIGSHGQTLWHHPDPPHSCSVQLGKASVIACSTSIPTVTDFRSMDIARGGQGAPLAPLFHQALFSDPEQPRLIVNIGGIANLSILPAGNGESALAAGFDTGPGNTLMDAWTGHHWDHSFDQGGELAASGETCQELLQILLEDEFFHLPPPKSTGLEYFNRQWLQSRLCDFKHLAPETVLATLAELSARSIAEAVTGLGDIKTGKLYICGGGAHNTHLMKRISACTGLDVQTTDRIGVAPDMVEATGFAWLAHCRLAGKRLTLTSPDGTSNTVPGHIPGGLYLP